LKRLLLRMKTGNMNNYPDNWNTEIRPNILKRAKNKCEQCGLPNYCIIHRTSKYGSGFIEKPQGTVLLNEIATKGASTCKLARQIANDLNKGDRYWKVVVLSVAHLDHCTENNREGNLKALCQSCYLLHDRYQYLKNSRITRLKKSGQTEIKFK
jgi:hypothetical protein